MSQKSSSNAPSMRRDRGAVQVFLCDPSAEAGRLLSALQSRGYAIVDVPLGLLVNRCRYETPQVVICDADAHEAKVKLTELIETTDDKVRVVLIGHAEGNLDREPSLSKMAAITFLRPLDIEATADSVTALCGPPTRRTNRPRIGRSARAPTLVTAARKPYRSDGGGSLAAPEVPDLPDTSWPVDSPPSRGPLSADFNQPPLVERVELSRSSRPTTNPPSSNKARLSPETASVLEAGKRRLDSYPRQSAARPVRLSMTTAANSTDLRAELLDALLEPLDDAEYGNSPVPRIIEETSAGTRNPAPDSSKRPTDAGHDTAPPPSLRSAVTFENELPPASASLSDDERTNPGGKPPTQPPPDSKDELFSANEKSRPGNLPPLDDLSDLLATTWGDSPRLGNQSLALTTPPPLRKRGSNQHPIDELESEHPGAFAAPSLPASLLPQAHALLGRDTEHTADLSEHMVQATARDPRLTPVTPQDAHAPQVGPQGAPPRGTTNSAKNSLVLVLAAAIRERQTGAVAQQDQGAVRRVVLTDGDISTVVSGLGDESLAHFLHVRGDLSGEILPSLGAIPNFGRHAGAALIARGLLQQEDLWPVLRAHAEWVMAKGLLSDAPAVLEPNVPARLLEEPAVFGGAAGTEIFLETIRRVITPNWAMRQLGGETCLLSWGKQETLLGESALTQAQQQAVTDALGIPLGNLMKSQPHILPILFGLERLGALSAGGEVRSEPVVKLQERNQEIEQEAFLSKFKARRALVDQGDYFAILGITRSATTYEVDRAKDELLEQFQEARLVPHHIHLVDDLSLLRATIEEAHMVLSDDVRRMRYKQAIEAMPR